MKSRRRIASPAQDYATYYVVITAGIYEQRNGVRPSFCVATILRTECPLWVKSGHSPVFGRCPLYPQKRTLIERVGMSAMCQKQTLEPPARRPVSAEPA